MSVTINTQSFVAIIGGGPAGLMAAEVIAQAGFRVELYDAMPSVGRKFLLAGVCGMNITHAEAPQQFITRYSNPQPYLANIIEQFNAQHVRDWVHGLGVETFVGTSKRVFPTDMKAAPLLRVWLHRLRDLGVKIYPRHRFTGWNETGELLIQHRIDNKIIEKKINPRSKVMCSHRRYALRDELIKMGQYHT